VEGKRATFRGVQSIAEPIIFPIRTAISNPIPRIAGKRLFVSTNFFSNWARIYRAGRETLSQTVIPIAQHGEQTTLWHRKGVVGLCILPMTPAR
jgi:hypothetical protein